MKDIEKQLKQAIMRSKMSRYRIAKESGLTESQLEEEISDILSPHKIKEPSVTEFLVNSQQRTYSILGNGVPNSSRYL